MGFLPLGVAFATLLLSIFLKPAQSLTDDELMQMGFRTGPPQGTV
jgi:hypothetical protein